MSTPLTLENLAKLTNAYLIKNHDLLITSFSASDNPSKDSVTFMLNKSFNPTRAQDFGAVLISKQSYSKISHDNNFNANFLVTDNPQTEFFKVILHFHQPVSYDSLLKKNSPIISDQVKLGQNCIIHPGAVVYPNVVIGKNTIIYGNVVIREGTTIGSNCIIQPNCVIGSDGFGYIADPHVGLKSVPQVGSVIIEDDVHIGACTTIDRGAIGDTVIGKGTKIDNQVQIGHNVKIGQFCILCGQVGIAGSCTIGDRVVLGGKVGVSDHVKIASDIRVGGGGIVLSDLEEKGDYLGSPAVRAIEYRKNTVEFLKLRKTLKDLRTKMA